MAFPVSGKPQMGTIVSAFLWSHINNIERSENPIELLSNVLVYWRNDHYYLSHVF